jgi:hypothetical protein
LKNDLPTAAVHDIAIHPRENDLIIGTHGRGVFILDNISFLQEMAPAVLDSPVHLFGARPATAFYQSIKRESFTKPAYAAKNPVYGLAVTAYFKAKPKEKPRVSILDTEDRPVFELELSTREGLHRDHWNLQTVPKTADGKKITPSATGFVTLPLIGPGEYTVELTVDGQKFRTPATVLSDPRLPLTESELAAQHEALAEILALSKKMGLAITAATNIRRQLDALAQDIQKEGRSEPSLDVAVRNFSDKFRSVEEKVVPREFGSTLMTRELALRGGALNQQIVRLGMAISGFPSAPTKAELFELDEIKRLVEAMVAELNQIITEDIPSLNGVLGQKGLKPLRAPEEAKL